MKTDWSQFKPSAGKGRHAWLVIEERPNAGLEGGTAYVEALVLADKDRPVMVELVEYGPRGGVRHLNNGGTVESMQGEVAELLRLIDIAKQVEDMR